jgi:hypothetical protein
MLSKALPDRATLQRALNRILRTQTPRFVKKGKRSYYIAIDLTLIPYHGECFEDEKEIVRSQAKSGTAHFTDTPRFPLCMTINVMCWRCALWKKASVWKPSWPGSWIG